ncbi:DsrE family protein [Altererythrobacter sp. H2]|uniref:DsrE family protein n=1 Tax=Altererythrobacter sp. H2 TaxID=3108391 RepID=UPI002B4BA880|nr:DsrE family protein [Altererythrobacter sp. H2]WRK96508.1 DsrE family protein [Altererythrobacter sp. H2]
MLAATGALFASPIEAETPPALPVPHYGAVVSLPDAANQPDPAIDYRVVFDISAAATDSSAPHPSLGKVARFLNLLATKSVRPPGGNIVAVIHGPATSAIVAHTAYRSRFAMDNPNLALIAELEAAGAQIHVCGQALHAQKIAASDVAPTVTIDLAALTTVATLQLRGFALIAD